MPEVCKGCGERHVDFDSVAVQKAVEKIAEFSKEQKIDELILMAACGIISSILQKEHNMQFVAHAEPVEPKDGDVVH